MKRYPLAALVDASGRPEAALKAVGLFGTTLKRAREHGLVESAADRYATRLGLHPWLVWPDWLEDVKRPCVECGAVFVPHRRNHLFCSKSCYQRRYKRGLYKARYQSDPVFRASEVERARRQRETNAAARRIKKAAYYRANKHLWVEARARRRAEREAS